MSKIVKASLKDLRMSPRKVGEVVALVRGRLVEDALVILSHTPRRTAKPVAKLIESARANAVNNHGLKAEGLKIQTISVTSGPRLKRFRPVSRGMAHPFQKRTAHVYVTLIGNEKPAKKPVIASETKQSSQNNLDRHADKSARDDKATDAKKGEK
jgi:large subunit ribosomal protein L22